MQKIGHSKVSSVFKKGKRSAFLFVLFFFFSPVSVFAYDWEEVLSAYLSVPISNPDKGAWLEKTPDNGYRVWERPTDSIWKARMTYSYVSHYLQGALYGVAWDVPFYNEACSCWWHTYTSGVNQTLAQNTVEVSCFAVEGQPVAGANMTRQFNVSCDSQFFDGNVEVCWNEKATEVPPPVDNPPYDCKSYDVLANTFPADEVTNCESRNLSISLDGSSVDTDPLITNSCQCTPAGTKYLEKTESGRCRYKNIVGDPTDPNTNITITAPGFTVLVSSPPVTTQVVNPDGTITVTDTVTNTYPDNTQSKDITSETKYPDSSVKTDVTTGANVIGGVTVGGFTITTLTAPGGYSSINSTYGSGLVTTTTTSPTAGAVSSVGTKKDATIGGSVWDAPPSSVIIPSVPSAQSQSSNYSTARPSEITDEQVTEKDIKTLIGDYISTSPIISAVQNTRIDTIDSECSFTSPDVFGSPVTLDFCSLQSMLQVFGILFVAVCTIRSFFILFGVE